MNEEKLNQILKNQGAIMNVLFSQFYGNKKGKNTLELLMTQMSSNMKFVVPKAKEPTLPEKTDEAFSEEGQKSETKNDALQKHGE